MMHRRLLLYGFLIIFFSTIILIPVSPSIEVIPLRDSGVFLYSGSQILHGHIPYRDFWDHKPPVIYYLNTLGLLLGNGSRWGVWLLEVLSLSIAGAFCFSLLKKAFGTLPALLGLIALGSFLFSTISGGNLTEEFALPLQFAAIHLFIQAEEQKGHAWRGYVIGVLLGVTFLLKQNLIGIWLSLLIYLLITRVASRRWHVLIVELVTILLGSISVLLVFVIFFATQGALADFWDAAFKYNFAYVNGSLLKRVKAILTGMRIVRSIWGIFFLSLTAYAMGLLYATFENSHRILQLLQKRYLGLPVVVLGVGVAAFGWGSDLLGFGGSPGLGLRQIELLVLGSVIILWGIAHITGFAHRKLSPFLNTRNKSLSLSPHARRLLYLSLIGLPIEWFLVGVSVRAYPHYYIPWIPVSVLLIGFFAYILDSMARVVYIHEKNRLAPFLLPAFIMVIGFQPLFAIALISLSVDVQRQKTVEYVQDHTSNMDSILIWGSEASIHFLTHRQAPTRFFYQYPLYMSGFTRPALIDELLIDLRTRKPKLIIDSKNCEAPLTRSFARECYELGQMQRYGVTYPSGLDKLNEYIASNYTLVDHIGPEEWPVFVYEGPPH